MSLQSGVLIAHVIAAAIAVGATISYAVWIALAERDPDHLAFTIRAVRRSDRLVAIPAFVIAGLTGGWLTIETSTIGRPWLAASVAIYLIVLIVGFTVFGPVVRRELVALERGGATDPDYGPLRRRAWLLSLGTASGLIVILVLMVAKPG